MTAGQPEKPPPTNQPPSSGNARAALIAAALTSGTAAATATAAAVTAASAVGLTAAGLAALTKLLVRWRYPKPVIRYALRVTTRIVSTPPKGRGTPGPAVQANDRNALTFAAWFIERTTERVRLAYERGAKPGEPEAREERFIDQHLDAQEKRRRAAETVDNEARQPGHVVDAPGGRVILRWRAHTDDKVTPECAAADGAWFYADTPPIIGYPGMPHGGTCRCWPAHAGSLAEVARGRHVNEAVRAIVGTDDQHPGTRIPAAAARGA